MRRADWVQRMWATIQSYQRTPFQFGVHDCALFSCRVVDAITDSELAGSFSYASKRAAMRYMRDQGGLEAAVSRRLGDPVTGYGARRGDICLIQGEDADVSLGPCVGPDIAALSNDGLAFVALRHALKHWRV